MKFNEIHQEFNALIPFGRYQDILEESKLTMMECEGALC